MLFFIALAICLREKFQIHQNAYWLVLLAFLLHEVYGNVLCGTDNPVNMPLAVCQHPLMTFFNQWVLAILVVFPIAYLFYPYVLKVHERFDNWAMRQVQRNALYARKRK